MLSGDEGGSKAEAEKAGTNPKTQLFGRKELQKALEEQGR